MFVAKHMTLHGAWLWMLLSLFMGSFTADASSFDFSYSGRLVDNTGRPLAGPVALKVSFYHSAGSTTSVLDVTTGIDNVMLKDGVFQIVLSMDASDFHRVFPSVSQDVFIEVTDLTNSPSAPYARQQLTTLPYAGKIPVDTSQFAWSSEGKLQMLSTGADASATATLTNKTIDASSNTITGITNANISGAAAIDDTKLATVSTAGKVSGSAITSGTIAGNTAVSTTGSISTTGKVGVGAAAGTSQLEVKGAGTSSATSSLNIMDAGGGSKLFVRDDGNVGIGTTSPAAALHALSVSEQFRLGYNGANYASFTVSSAGALTIGTTGGSVTANTFFASPIVQITSQLRGGSGNLTLTDHSSATNWNLLRFGGATSAYPALKRSSAELQVRLADDSGFGDLQAGQGLFNGLVGIGTTSPASTLSGPSASTFAIAASAPAQAAASVAGNAITINGSSATAGSSTAGAAAGGSVAITAGDAQRLTSGNAVGGDITLTAGTGAGSLGGGGGGAISLVGGVGNPSNGPGGAITLTGGTATGGSAGGSVTINGGAGPVAGGVNINGGVGSNGHISITSGVGAGGITHSGNISIIVPDVSSNTRNPGSITIRAGRGNYSTNTNAYGSGGSISLTTQSGANSNNGALPTNTGGSITTTLGAGGNNTGGGTAGTGGNWSVTGASGGTGSGAGSIGGLGSTLTLTSGAGGAGVATGGNSGAIVLQTGAPGSGAVAGIQGAIQLAPTSGNVGIGTTSPQAKLHVESGAICVSAGAGSNDCSSAANTAGTIFAVNTTVQGADYAEYFASEDTLSPGEIVGINPRSGLVRRYHAGDKLVGVVSTQPGVIGNSKIKDTKSVLVALMGQVPFNRKDTRTEGNIIKTHDGVQIGFMLASGDLYLQISSADKKIQESRAANNLEIAKLKAEKDNEILQLKADHDLKIYKLKAENDSIKSVLCELKPEADFCE